MPCERQKLKTIYKYVRFDDMCFKSDASRARMLRHSGAENFEKVACYFF